MDAFFFYAFALLTLGGAIQTVTRRNAVHSAIWLIVSLLGVAGLFLLAGAEFLFVVQIVLYVGGIMVLFLFVIMLVNLDRAARERQFSRQWKVALVAVAGSMLGLLAIRKWPSATLPELSASAGGNTEAVGQMLFHDYLLPFEIASVLLLVAIVGSVLMARKRTVLSDGPAMKSNA